MWFTNFNGNDNSYKNASVHEVTFLPPASLGQCNVLTSVRHSVHGGGGVGFPACITGHMTRGEWGLHPGGVG